MNRRLALSIALGALFAGRAAFAQEVTIGYQGLPYKASGETNTGIQVSDGVLLHAGIGAEIGYDTNVFYAATDAVGATIIRVMPYAELTNATRTGAASNMFTFDIRAGLQYRRYESDNALIQQDFARRLDAQRRAAAELRWRPIRVWFRRRLRQDRGPALREWRRDHRSRAVDPQQQPGVTGRALVSGGRSADQPPPLHQHGRHLRRRLGLFVRQRDDEHAHARRRVEMAPQDGDLRECTAELRRLSQQHHQSRHQSGSPIRIRCGWSAGLARPPDREDLGRPLRSGTSTVSTVARVARRRASGAAPSPT